MKRVRTNASALRRAYKRGKRGKVVSTSLSRIFGFGAVVVLAGTLATALIACGSDDDGGGGGEGEEEVELLLSFPESIVWTALIVAREQGYFEEEGISVSTQETEGSGFVVQQSVAGNADFGWAGSDSIIIGYAQEPALRSIMCDDGQNIFRISVPEDSDIQSVEDLAGRTLGITEKGGGEEPLVNSSLGEAGIRDEVEIVPIGAGGPQSKVAVEDGAVDAYASTFIEIAILEASGIALRDITPEEFAATQGDCLVTTSAVLEDPASRETAVGIARAWKKGMVFTEANPEAALEMVCEEVPEECQDRAVAEQILAQQIELYPPVDPDLETGEPDPTGWQTTADVLAETESIGREVDVTDLVDSQEVQSVVEDWQLDEETRASVVEDAESFQP